MLIRLQLWSNVFEAKVETCIVQCLYICFYLFFTWSAHWIILKDSFFLLYRQQCAGRWQYAAFVRCAWHPVCPPWRLGAEVLHSVLTTQGHLFTSRPSCCYVMPQWREGGRQPMSDRHESKMSTDTTVSFKKLPERQMVHLCTHRHTRWMDLALKPQVAIIVTEGFGMFWP